MEYYNEQDELIDESQVDLTKGYIESDRLFVEHHDAVEEVEEKTHYRVKCFYFDDGASYEPTTEDDAHIEVVDAENGVFNYVDQGEEKVCRGIDLETVVDSEKVEAKEAYDEYKDIIRYILYTDEELAAQQAAKEKSAVTQEFLENGPEQLNTNTSSIEDLTLIMSDLIGGETE
jgi:hypothetical protein